MFGLLGLSPDVAALVWEGEEAKAIGRRCQERPGPVKQQVQWCCLQEHRAEPAGLTADPRHLCLARYGTDCAKAECAADPARGVPDGDDGGGACLLLAEWARSEARGGPGGGHEDTKNAREGSEWGGQLLTAVQQ